MIEISIIVPVYNVENYIVRCLDSIYSQRISIQIEVIAVNDASTDDSLKLLEEYREKQSSLIIIDKAKNEKLSKAFASGLAKAKGRYVMRIDSDDWIKENALEILLSDINRTRADVFIFNYCISYKGYEKDSKKLIRNNLTTTDKSFVAKYFLGTAVTKLVKRELTLDMVLDKYEFNSGEDLIFCAEIFLRAESFTLMEPSLYVYFYNPNSITQTVDNKSFLDSRLFLLKVLADVKNNSLNSNLNFNKLLENKFRNDIIRTVFKFWINNLDLSKEKLRVKSILMNFSGFQKETLNSIERSMTNFYCALYFMLRYNGIRQTVYALFECQSLRGRM